MIEKIDLNKSISKKEYKMLSEQLVKEFASLQRELKELEIPVMILFEGWGASGKGTLINQMIHPLDPRGFRVYSIQRPSQEEFLRPFLWRFWTKTPEKGKIHIFDRSWYQRVLLEAVENSYSKESIRLSCDEIMNFEEQLMEDGVCIIKFFLHISRDEQAKRFRKLEKSEETKWRVTKEDWKHNDQYHKFLKITDEVIIKTDTSFSPWTIVEATEREYAAIKILNTIVERLREVKNVKLKQLSEKTVEEIKLSDDLFDETNKIQDIHWNKKIEYSFENGVLQGVDLSKSLEKEEYKERLKELQEKLSMLHNEMYVKRIPVILAFEGWDAGGKGGAIKRVTECLDPRGYEVIPIASPNDIERKHHYLWRFWNHIPKAGHMAIFDRTWYGRVMVERIEGFCSEEEWKRAYNEINQMEEHLSNFGCMILKFWMHIDKEEQEKRFKERQTIPEKQWKITQEDWRNREKWDEYEKAVDEMLVRTSTPYAPWIVVEANSKYYARIKVLETIVESLEKKIQKWKS